MFAFCTCWVHCQRPAHEFSPQDDTQSKVSKGFMEIAALLFEQESREDRWFQMLAAVKPYAFGCQCHNFLGRALRLMCPLTPEDTEEALKGNDQDDSATHFSKRLKRGVKRLIGEDAAFALTLASYVARPLQTFNFELFGEAKDERLQPSGKSQGHIRSVLRRLLAGDRLLIRSVGQKFGSFLNDDAWFKVSLATLPLGCRRPIPISGKCGACTFVALWAWDRGGSQVKLETARRASLHI